VVRTGPILIPIAFEGAIWNSPCFSLQTASSAAFISCRIHTGRIKDLVESGKLSLSAVKFFILDEADRLLDTGNQDLILNLFSRFPKAGTGTARLQVYHLK